MTKTDFLWLAFRARLSFLATAAHKRCLKPSKTFIMWLHYNMFDEKHEAVVFVVSTDSSCLGFINVALHSGLGGDSFSKLQSADRIGVLSCNGLIYTTYVNLVRAAVVGLCLSRNTHVYFADFNKTAVNTPWPMSLYSTDLGSPCKHSHSQK